MRLLCGVSAIALISGNLTFVGSATAATVNISFSGTVSSVSSVNTTVPGNVQVGNSLTGWFSYETDEATLYSQSSYNQGMTTDATYQFPAGGVTSGLNVVINGLTWSTGTDSVVYVRDNEGTRDAFFVGRANGSSTTDQFPSFPGLISQVGDHGATFWILNDTNDPTVAPNLVSSNSLPTSANNINVWNPNGIVTSYGEIFSASGQLDFSSSQYRINFDVDPNSFSIGQVVTPPPVPAFDLPLSGLDYVYTNVIAGGAAFDGIDDPFHYPNAAYYSIDFDVNRDTDGDGVADSANVVAAGAGTIVAVGGTGKCAGEPVCVVIDHGNGYYTEYREFSSLTTGLTVGMTVSSGDLLGYLLGGNTRTGCAATCTPDHLHFQVLYDLTGNGPSTGDSSQSVTQLQGVTIGGLQLTDFSLGPSGVGQGAVGFIHSGGDLSAHPDGVLDYTTTNLLIVGQSLPGQMIVNGPIALDVQNALSVGTTTNGEMYVVNGAQVTAQSITVGGSVGGQGYLLIDNGASVDGGSFVGIGTNSPTGTSAGGIGTVELLNGGQIQAGAVSIGDLGSLRMNGGSITGNLTMSGGVMLLGSSPGTGSIFGDFTMTGGVLDIEIGGTTGGLFDVLNIFGDANLLGGTIGISFLNGFLPSIGDTFDFLNVSGSTNFSGTRFSVNGLPSNLGLSFVPASGGGYTAVAIANNPAPVPLPSSFAPILTALVGLFGVSRVRRQRTLLAP